MNHVEPAVNLHDIHRLIERREFDSALTALEEQVRRDSNPEFRALLGLVHFHRESYEQAARHYEAAVKARPENKDWADMLERVRANRTSEIHVPVPAFYFFERDALLSLPEVAPAALPQAKGVTLEPSDFRLFLRVLGNSVGVVATLLMNSLTQLWGRVAGYRDAVWTNWYRRPTLLGILTLAHMRELLNAHNLKNTYPTDALTGFVPLGLTPPAGVTHYSGHAGSGMALEVPPGAKITERHHGVVCRASAEGRPRA